MPFQVSPGVNVSEIDLTTVIPAVSTTEAAIAGHFNWGPVSQRVLISDENKLVATFGLPDSNTAVDFFSAADFLAYGNKLYVVRTASTNANNASAAALGRSVLNDEDYDNNFASGVPGAGNWVARYPGLRGNSLKVSVCQSANAFTSTISGNIAYTDNSTAVTGNNTAFTTDLVVGDLLVLGADGDARKVASIANNTSLTLASAYSGNTVTINTTNSGGITRRWEYFGNFDIAPGTSEFASNKGGSGDELHVVVVDEDGVITGTNNAILETYQKVSRASDAKTEDGATNYYKNAINQKSKYIRWAAHDSVMTSAGSLATSTFTNTDDRPQTDSLSGGRDGSTPTNAQKINAYNYFANPDEIDVSIIIGSNANTTVALHIINNILEVRKDCVGTFSPEHADVVNNASYVGKQVDDSVTFRNTLPSSSYAIMDSGWKYRYDKYNDIYRYSPLNADVAGLIVQTDRSRDPWWSPAGFNRGFIKNAIRLAYNPTKAQQDILYKNGINPVVAFPGQGVILYGDKTMLSKPSAFDRINVRRLFIILEKAIATASKFSLFEFNDDFTRAQFKNLVDPFLRDVQGRRGIIEFLTVCNGTNNTPEVIDRNEFVGDIYIKPSRSINFIQLNFVAVRTGVEFNEIVGRF